jgi:hypothetical protein
MANKNNNIQIGEGYSVDLTALHDAVITHRVTECRNAAFGEGELMSQEALKALYENIDKAHKENKILVINVANHPSSTWSEKQRAYFGDDAVIVDIPHPAINPKCTADDLDVASFGFADWLVSLVNGKVDKTRVCFIIAGAQGFIFRVVGFLLMAGYNVFEATSERNTTLNPDGSKIVRFDFIDLRRF